MTSTGTGRRMTSPPLMDSYQQKKLMGSRLVSSSVSGDFRPRTRTDASLLSHDTSSSVPVGRTYPHEAESLERVVMLERQIQVRICVSV